MLYIKINPIVFKSNLPFASLSKPIYNMRPSWNFSTLDKPVLVDSFIFMHTFMEKHNAGNS